MALARALVLNPKILLLDEPLSNLDAKVRVQVRAEIRKLQKELGITTVYVTHDQEEALTLSDRIAVFNQGRVFQVGTPRELYERPRTASSPTSSASTTWWTARCARSRRRARGPSSTRRVGALPRRDHRATCSPAASA